MIFSLHIEPSDCGWLCLSERQELSRFQSLEIKGTTGGSGPHRFLSGLTVFDVACRTAGGTWRAKMPQILSHLRWLASLLAGVFLSVSPSAYGQKPAGAGSGNRSLPDSPQPKQPAIVESSGGTAQRFIGYVSNKSFVFPDIAASEGPLPVSAKFKIFINQSISPPIFLRRRSTQASVKPGTFPRPTGRAGTLMADASERGWRGRPQPASSALLFLHRLYIRIRASFLRAI